MHNGPLLPSKKGSWKRKKRSAKESFLACFYSSDPLQYSRDDVIRPDCVWALFSTSRLIISLVHLETHLSLVGAVSHVRCQHFPVRHSKNHSKLTHMPFLSIPEKGFWSLARDSSLITIPYQYNPLGNRYHTHLLFVWTFSRQFGADSETGFVLESVLKVSNNDYINKFLRAFLVRILSLNWPSKKEIAGVLVSVPSIIFRLHFVSHCPFLWISQDCFFVSRLRDSLQNNDWTRSLRNFDNIVIHGGFTNLPLWIKTFQIVTIWIVIFDHTILSKSILKLCSENFQSPMIGLKVTIHTLNQKTKTLVLPEAVY